MKLTQPQARRFLLKHQRLLPTRAHPGKEAALEFLRQVRCIQFDPLDVVGCNPHLVLQARVAGYRPNMLDALLYQDRLLVDGFDKQLSIWPVEDWPCFARERNISSQWYEMDSPLLLETQSHVLEEIARRGPLSSADFEARGKVRWPWGPTNAVRAALESLYFRGELAVHHKAGTRKYYDLASRHISLEILAAADPHPEDCDYFAWRLLRRAGSVGLIRGGVSDALLGIGMKGEQREQAFQTLQEQKLLLPVEVEGFSRPLYVRAEDAPGLEGLDTADEASPTMAFLAPLDNLIWDRKLIEALFGFAYRWEVYTPAAQRKYGWYVLPVLYGDRFIARVEPRFDKKAKVLELMNWWWEPGVKPDAAMKKAFRACVREFMKYLGAKELKVGDGWQGPKL